jgi:SagB-type dehydrogenase family enzyme
MDTYFLKYRRKGDFSMPAPGERQSSVTIPPLASAGKVSVEEAIARRRSVRHLGQKPLSLGALSQILWAAQGLTDSEAGFRAAPSAGALYPLELYVVARKDGVEGLPEGVDHYESRGHLLTLIRGGDFTHDLEAATWDQGIVMEAAATIVMIGAFSRTAAKYGRRGTQHVFQESGHAAQNVFLQAAALGIGTVVMEAFSEGAVRRVVGIRLDGRPLYVQPIGTPAQG